MIEIYKGKGLILIVDDDKSVRDMLKRKFEPECYFCITAGSGEEALDRALEHDFEVVLLDIRMPGLSGMEVLPKLVHRYPNVSVIMLTAVTDVDKVGQAIALGAYDYVTKPVNLKDLSTRVAKGIARSRLITERYKVLEPLSKFSRTVRQAAISYQEVISNN